MRCDPCLLLPRMFYNHLKEMCEKCLSDVAETSVLLILSESKRNSQVVTTFALKAVRWGQ